MGESNTRCLFRRIIFFSKVVEDINNKYPTLFNKDDEEDGEEGKGQIEKDGSFKENGSSAASDFSSR